MKARNAKGQYMSNKKALFWVFILLMAVAGMFALSTDILDAFRVKEEPTASPLAEPTEPTEEEVDEMELLLAGLNETERKICETFGVLNCQVALAVSEAENSRRDPEAYNFNSNNTLDVGIFQVNQTHWYTEYCPHGLHDLTTIDTNIKCAYAIWDRADGTEGDGKGNWTPWTQFNNGVFINNL